MADKRPTTKDIYLLSQNPNLAPQFDQVYGDGAAAQVLTKVRPQAVQQQAPQPQGSYAGAAIRGMAPPLLGAAMGAPFGPVGMVAGGLALPAADALTALINTATAGAEKVTGGQYGRMTMPSQAAQDLLTQLGVSQAETTGQRALQTGLGALGSTASQLSGLQTLARTATTPMARAISTQMAERPVAQMVTSVPAGAAGQTAAELAQGYGPVASTLASMAASTGVGAAGMRTRKAPAQTNAEIRAAEIAAKAKDLGFIGETALTPGQAGTSKTAQIFEATAGTIPFSSGQFTKRYGKQSDYAQGIIS